MVEFKSEYLGDLRCSAIHGPSGVELFTDAPTDNHGKGAHFSPTDLTATSLGTCMMTTMGIVASRQGVELRGMKAVIRKIMTSEPPRKIARIEVTLTLPLPGDHPDRALLEKTALGCPVARSLHPDVEQVVEFIWS